MDPLMIGGFFEFHQSDADDLRSGLQPQNWWLDSTCLQQRLGESENGCLLWRWYEFMMLMVWRQENTFVNIERPIKIPFGGHDVWLKFLQFKALQRKLSHCSASDGNRKHLFVACWNVGPTVNAKRSSKQVVSPPGGIFVLVLHFVLFCWKHVHFASWGLCVDIQWQPVIYSKFSSVPSIHPNLIMSFLSFHLRYFWIKNYRKLTTAKLNKLKMVDFKLHLDSSPKRDLLICIKQFSMAKLRHLALRFVEKKHLHQLWA